MASALLEVADGVFSATQPLRFGGVAGIGGLELGARMTVVRLPDGGLFLHSPIEPVPALREAVAAIGPVRHVVAPNRFHHLFAGRWSDGADPVRIHVAPGLAAKRPDLPAVVELGAQADPAWAGTLDQQIVAGMPLVNEVAFLHRPSRTLILCDLAFHVGPDDAPATRFFFRLIGAYDRLATTWLERALCRDRAATRAGVEAILAWDFDRVIVSHGRVLDAGGRAAFERAWSWLLRA